MMRVLFVLFLLLFFQMDMRASDKIDLETLRREYLRAVENSDKTDSLLAVLSKMDGKAPLMLAYQGACEALQAKHHWNPYKKVALLKQAQSTLAQAVAQEPQNVEIRFLRFSMQHYLPTFLGQSNDLDADRKAIAEHIKSTANASLGKKTLQTIAKFMIDSGRCSATEIKVMKEVLQ